MKMIAFAALMAFGLALGGGIASAHAAQSQTNWGSTVVSGVGA